MGYKHYYCYANEPKKESSSITLKYAVFQAVTNIETQKDEYMYGVLSCFHLSYKNCHLIESSNASPNDYSYFIGRHRL